MKQILLAWGMSLLPLLPQAGTAQTARRSITLDEAILLARVQSVDAAVALNELKTAYWEYRTFQANLLPEISFTATLPSFITRNTTPTSRTTEPIPTYAMTI